MQRLEVSGAVRPIYVSLGVKRLIFTFGVIKQLHDYRTCSRTSPLQLQSVETPYTDYSHNSRHPSGRNESPNAASPPTLRRKGYIPSPQLWRHSIWSHSKGGAGRWSLKPTTVTYSCYRPSTQWRS